MVSDTESTRFSEPERPLGKLRCNVLGAASNCAATSLTLRLGSARRARATFSFCHRPGQGTPPLPTASRSGSVPRLPSPQSRLQHLLMQVGEPQDVRLPRRVASERKLLPKVLLGRRGRARSFKPGKFIAVARFDAGQHRQLVLNCWLQVGWIPQVFHGRRPPPLMFSDSKVDDRTRGAWS